MQRSRIILLTVLRNYATFFAFLFLCHSKFLLTVHDLNAVFLLVLDEDTLQLAGEAAEGEAGGDHRRSQLPLGVQRATHHLWQHCTARVDQL